MRINVTEAIFNFIKKENKRSNNLQNDQISKKP
jgi:hypothetical protein